MKFADVEILKSPDEIKSELETNFKYHLSNPIDVLMERHGVGREEAENILAENKEINKGGGEQEPQSNAFGAPGQQPETQALARLVAQRKSAKNNDEDNEEEADADTD